MKNLTNLNDVNSKIIVIRNQNVILDSDVAKLYGVETMHINQAVKNNLEKFPEGYILELSKKEKQEVINFFDNLKIKPSPTLPTQEVIEIFDNPKLKFSPALPKAFTEKGLYMLATILKSSQATQTTIAIIEAFTKMRQMSNSIAELMHDHENEQKQKTVIQKGESLFGEIIGSALETVNTESSFELNLAALKIKHTVKRSKQ